MTSNKPRFIAYHTGPFTQLDHLGTLAIEWDIPLIASDPNTIELAQKYYPELKVHLINESESLDFLASHCDILLGCGKYWAIELQYEFSQFFNKSMRMLFCPHGNSDKGRSLTPDMDHPPQDIALFYGQQMLDLWKKTGVLTNTKQWTFSGNYRLPYYLKRRSFYDELAQPFFSRFSPEKKTIFYAPSWPDKENPSPIFQVCEPLIENLRGDFNLLIKLHPLLAEKYPAETYRLLGLYEDHPEVQILFEFPPVYPLLSKVDLYLGDFSSIGYDALAFDLPLYFLIDDSSVLQGSDLAKTGITLPMHEIENLYSTIDRTLAKNKSDFQKARKDLYDYAFGEPREMGEVKEEVETLFSLEKRG